MIGFTQQGIRLICRPEVDVVASTVSELRKRLIEHLDANDWGELIFDCHQVSSMDSVGVNLIVGLYKKAGGADRQFCMINCNEPILKVLKLFRLDEKFTIEASALGINS